MFTLVRPPTSTRTQPLDWAVYALIAFFSLIQDAGRTTLDTRVELSERPTSFLAGGFQLWHDSTNFGELLNQAYGYIFPQGAFFVLVELSGMPPWVGQRLWCALVLLAAYEGARRCAKALGFEATPATLAGLVFAFSPRMLGTVGVISAESLPGAMLPWAVLPILLGARGQLRPARAAILSGAAVVCMGGVNAVEVIGSLPMPMLFALWVTWKRLLPWRFLAWWGGAVSVACAWWLLPLLTLGRYSPPFYQYVESARNTTGVIGWSEALRGDSHWVAFITAGGRGWWPAAYSLMFDPWLILAAAAVAAVGLIGLVQFRGTMRTPLLVGAAVGLSALTIAHGGWEGSPLSGFFLEALEGPLQVFRNVHKVDPTVRFALAMGFAQSIAGAMAWSVERKGGAIAGRVIPALAGALVLVLGHPFLVNDVRSPGWTEIPVAWHDAYDYLAERQDGTTTLVVPGSGFSLQTWGWTYDEPMHALGEDVRWASRSQIPIIPGQSIRVLSALDRLVSQGQADRTLGSQLARAGIGHVLVRRDLNRGFTSSPPPAGAGVSLASAGIPSVAKFGDQAEGGSEIEIYEVAERLPHVRSTLSEDVATVAGAPEAWIPLMGTGLIDRDVATVSAGEAGWPTNPTIVTDTNQRRERAFGRVDEPLSTVLEKDEAYRLDRSVPDYPVTPRSKQVVAEFADGASVRASTSQGYADVYGSVVSQSGPQAAFDGNEQTRWISSLSGKAREQWLRVDFAQPRRVDTVSIVPVMDDRAMAPIRTMRVRTSSQSLDLDTNSTGAAVNATFSGEPVRWLEVRVVAAATVAQRNQVAISDIRIDGESLGRTLVLPDELERGDALLLTGGAPTRACRATGFLPDCDVVRIRASEEPGGIRRRVEIPHGAALAFEGLAMAKASRPSAQLLEPFLSEQQVGATSIYGDDPLVASRFAYDGRDDTQWLADPADPEPTLFFRWGVERRITAIRLPVVDASSAGFNRVIIRGAGRSEELAVTGELTQLTRPMQTTMLDVAFVKDERDTVVSVPEIDLDGGGIIRPFDPDQPTGAVCGLGPPIMIGSREIATRVDGTLGDVLSGSPLHLSSCVVEDADGPTPITTLSSGSTLFHTIPTAEFEVVAISGRPAARTTGQGRAVEVSDEGESWLKGEVADGPETVISLPWNFNAGWVARLGTQSLSNLRVDGWQQGWVVPAGEGGVLTVEFAPQGRYTTVLILGLTASGSLLLAGVGLLLIGGWRRRRRHPEPWRPWPDAGPTPLAVRAALVPVVALGFGWVGAGAYLVSSVWLRRDLNRIALIILALVVGSGALDAWPQPVPSSLADAAAVAAFGAALALSLRSPSRKRDLS